MACDEDKMNNKQRNKVEVKVVFKSESIQAAAAGHVMSLIF